MKSTCKDCHFLAKECREETTGRVHTFSLKEPERAAPERVGEPFSVKCEMGVWDEGVAPHLVDRNHTVCRTSREDCFFWPYQPAMVFSVARELQKRDQECRELKRSHLYTQVGLWIAAFALLSDVIIRLWLGR